jgi:putative transcriptional regulator
MLYIPEGRSRMGLSMNRLREFREKAGLTQDRLAVCVKVSRQTINSIEAGRYVPSLELALRLGRVFGCRVEDLFGIPEVDDAGKA